jgi:hypothetical protein
MRVTGMQAKLFIRVAALEWAIGGCVVADVPVFLHGLWCLGGGLSAYDDPEQPLIWHGRLHICDKACPGLASISLRAESGSHLIGTQPS